MMIILSLMVIVAVWLIVEMISTARDMMRHSLDEDD